MTGITCAMLVSVQPPLSASISPPNLYKFGSGVITSDPATCVVQGGAAPYTYAWTYVSGQSYTINSPSSASTTFTTSISAGVLKSGVYRCTVTDARSASVQVDITVDFEG